MRGLKYLRVNHELTQAQVADAIGLTQSHYAKIEAGHVQPKMLQLVKLAKLYDVSIEDLM